MKTQALGLVLLLPMLTGLLGCREVSRKPAAPVQGDRLIVETYPPAIDPALLPKTEPTPIPEPQVIESGEKSTLIYACRHVRSEILKDALEGLVSLEGTVEFSPELNRILVRDDPEMIPGILKLIQALDQHVPQLLVEARIVEVTLDSDLEYELQHLFTRSTDRPFQFFQPGEITLETPGSTPNPTMGALLSVRPWVADTQQLDTYIRLLVTKGKAKILSSPNLVVMVGREASIITGEEIPIQSATVVSGSVSTTTQFKPVGIKLRVNLLRIAGDTAEVEIRPEVSTVTGFTAAGETGVSNPIVAVRNVSTTLSLKDGEILTIGGLLRSEDRKVVRKVPGLSRIPLLGHLFQARRTQVVKTQLVFFLRINILEAGEPHTIRLHQPGVGLERLDDEVERALPENESSSGL